MVYSSQEDKPPFSTSALQYLLDRKEYDRFDWYIERYLNHHPDTAILHLMKGKRYYNEAMDYWTEQENYPMWGTLFEAKDQFMCNWILKHIDELYDIGIGVMDGGDYFNAMLFIAGAGYSFYEAHWIPLYVDLLKWVKVKV